jgi:outer membrane protein OmpA-like peptidoglycan-associated protein
MEVPADAAYQEINKEVKLKGVNFGQPVTINNNDSIKKTTNNEVSYITVGGRLFDKDNNPLNTMKVNLMNSEGEVIKTTTTDALGWFLFSELPPKDSYVVGLDEQDTDIGRKSFVEFKDAKGNVLKTKNLGAGKYQAANGTTVKFKPKEKTTAAANVQPLANLPKEKLAQVDRLDFKMNFKYNVSEVDVNDQPFKEYIDNLMALYNKNGSVNLKVESSASTVPTRAFKSNKDLSIARANKGKEQIINALKEKGVDESKIKIVSTKCLVGGPQYNIDYLQNKEKYERYQYIKISGF